MLTLRLIRREAPGSWPLLAVLGCLVALLTLASVAWPPTFDRLATRALAGRVAQAADAGPLLSSHGVFGRMGNEGSFPGEVAPGSLDRDLDSTTKSLRDLAGPMLRGAIKDQTAWAETSGVDVTTAGLPQPFGQPTHLFLGYPQGAGRPGSVVDYAQGRAPVGLAPDGAVEIAVSEATRDAAGLTVGQEFHLAGESFRTDVLLVGVFRPGASGSRLWRHLPLLEAPFAAVTPDGKQLNAEALAGAAGLEALAGQAARFSVTWDLTLGIDRDGPAGTAAGVATLGRQASAMESVGLAQVCGSPNVPDSCPFSGFLLSNFGTVEWLTPLLADFAAQRDRTEQVQGFALAGLLTVVVATAVAAARLAVRRRSAAFALQLARGARVSGLALRLLLEALPAVLLGASAGWWAARALAPSGLPLGPPGPAELAGALVWCAPAVTVLCTAGRAAAVRSRRLVAEASVLLLAVAGLAAVRSRGAWGGAGHGTDPLLALVPALLGLVTVLLLLRILPALLRPAARWARRRTGAVPLVALARSAQETGAAALALLVLVLALGDGVFGGLVSGTVRQSQGQVAAWRTGGDLAVLARADRLPPADQLAKLPGVGHAVRIRSALGDLTAQEDGTTYHGATLVGLDAAALAAAVPSSPVARALRAAGLPDAPVTMAGSAGTEPVLAALGDPGLLAAYPSGTFELSGTFGARMLVHLVGTVPEAARRDPALGPVLGDQPPSGPLLIVSGAAVDLLPRQQFRTSAVLLYQQPGGPRIDPVAVLATAAAAYPPATDLGAAPRVRDRAAELARLRDNGLVGSIDLAFALATGIALALALLAVALDLMLSAAERGRTVSYLRTLGLGSRASATLQLAQLLPLALAAAVGGTALGLLVPAALGPVFELREFTGGPFEPVRQIDWTTTAGLGLGLALLVLGTAVLETVLGRRRRLGSVLRLGETL